MKAMVQVRPALSLNGNPAASPQMVQNLTAGLDLSTSTFWDIFRCFPN